jgi:hypothetical protein
VDETESKVTEEEEERPEGEKTAVINMEAMRGEDHNKEEAEKPQEWPKAWEANQRGRGRKPERKGLIGRN